MKRSLLIPLAVFFVIAGVGAAVTYWPRTVPLEECSELYRHYAGCPDIQAAYIKDYKVNDTLTLSATILQAASDTGWAILLKDFDIEPYPPEILAMIKNTNSVEMKYVKRGTLDGQMDSVIENNHLIAISHFNHYITIFDPKSSDDVYSIIYKQARDSYN